MTSAGPGAELAISGALDYAARDDLVAHVEALMSRASPGATLFLTLGAVDFIDSSGVATLVTIKRLAAGHGCSLVLTKVPQQVSAMLTRCGLASFF